MSEDVSGKVKNNDFIAFPQRITELFTPKECLRIIDLGESLQTQRGIIGKKDINNAEQKIRNSEVKWLGVRPENNWVFERIRGAINQANQYYNFDLRECSHLQVASYAEGGHYTWHEDIGQGATSNRKLSLSVQLSDPSDYDGGELGFLCVPSEKIRHELKQQGTAIIFPAFLAHQVAVVTRGMRRSLVAWVSGPPFR
jgi:PKHD-type hydroxylase